MVIIDHRFLTHLLGFLVPPQVLLLASTNTPFKSRTPQKLQARSYHKVKLYLPSFVTLQKLQKWAACLSNDSHIK